MDGSPMQEPPVGRASPPNETSAPWPLWQRITFRFLLVYYLLYAFPRPLSNLIGTGAGVIAMVAGQADAGESTAWVEQAPWRWPGKWQKQLGHVEVWRQSATTWLDQHHLAPLEVIHQRTGSGDTAHDIALVLADLFAAAFGDHAITAVRIAFALAAYQRTLLPDQTPFDDYAAGDTAALTPDQVQGMNLFFGAANCSFCHPAPMFSDDQFHSLGLRPASEDPGRFAISGVAATGWVGTIARSIILRASRHLVIAMPMRISKRPWRL